MHQSHNIIRRYECSSSFYSDIPLWINLTNYKSLFDYFKDKFNCNDVMVVWNVQNKPTNLNDIEDYCKERNWRCTSDSSIRGSEASVTILYDFVDFYDFYYYEWFTRAKTQLIIVTTDEHQRCFL